jgi:DNA-binding MurR/RpiR family transcriptional regulator
LKTLPKTDPAPFRIEEAAVETLNGKSVHHCLRQRFSTLTALETRVISTILSQCTVDETTLLKAIADETRVSNAMVVKIAKKLGFDGFRALRAALAEHNRLPLAKLHQELRGPAGTRALAEQARQASLRALQEAFSLVSFDSLERAARWLYAARQRDLYGVGGSAHVARDAACKFLRIGLRTSPFEDSAMMLMSAALLQKGDVVVAFSSSVQTLAVLEAVRQARKNGAQVIALTNNPGSRLAHEADAVLCATAEDSPLIGEHGAARVAQLALLDALFLAVAQSNPAATEASLSCTMAALRAQRAPW